VSEYDCICMSRSEGGMLAQLLGCVFMHACAIYLCLPADSRPLATTFGALETEPEEVEVEEL